MQYVICCVLQQAPPQYQQPMCVTVCCSVLQCVAVWCSVVQCSAICYLLRLAAAGSSAVLVGNVWCSVVQCVAVWCIVMQCGAAW